MDQRFLQKRDAFPKSVDEYNQQVEEPLQQRRAELDATWRELQEGWKANNERMGTLEVRPRTNDENVVQLNVGGSNVTVCWHLLAEAEGFKDSILGALLEGVWGKGRIPRDADDRIVLDESPVGIKHIVHAMLTGRSSSAVVGLPESAAGSAVASDEIPCLTYTAHVMGLPGYVPAHPKYADMKGGSTILEPFEIAPASATIRGWAMGPSAEMTLIYRATRDGFGRKPFRARCNDSPWTVSLLRVSPGQGSEDDDDSVFGVFAAIPWGGAVGSSQIISEASSVFMLKDGSSTRKGSCKPVRWDPNFCYVDETFVVPKSDGPYFGADDLVTTFDKNSGVCTVQTKLDETHFPIDSDPLFLALNGRKVVEIEVYRYSHSKRAPPTITAPSTTKSDGDVLADAKAHDIRSFGEKIASSFMEERVILDRDVKEMEAAGARVSAAVGALEAVYGPSVAAGVQDTVVELNVRGTRMTTLRSTLQACPRSALAAMFNEDRWPATDKDKDEHGRRLIDCNPSCFSKILDVLRMRKRASWSRGATPEKQEGSRGKCSGAILIRQANMKAFRTAVEMYFPGCESFVMGLCRVYTTRATWFRAVIKVSRDEVHLSVRFFLIVSIVLACPDCAGGGLCRARAVSWRGVLY